MATKLQKLLVSIEPERISQQTLNRTFKAINSFLDPVEISSWESFKYYMLIFLEYLDENAQLFEPVYIFVGNPWDRCDRLFTHIYGNNGQEVAFDIARTGKDGGLDAVTKAVALHLVDEYTKNEITARIDCYWQSLSLEQRVRASSEYISKYGHLFRTDFKGENTVHILANFPKVLEKHSRMFKESEAVFRRL